MRRILLAFAVGVVACVAATWPAAATWNTHTLVPLGYADVQAGLWWPHHVGEAVLAGRDPFQAPELFWPAGQDVTLLVWNVLAELLLFPLWHWFSPNAALNLAAFVVAGLNAAASAAAVRRLSFGVGPNGTAGAAVAGADGTAPRSRAALASWAPELAAAALAGASHFAFLEMVNGRIEQALWAPVVLVLAELVAPDPRAGRAAVWLGLAAAVYWFYGYFLALGLVGFVVARRSRAALRFAAATGAGSLLVAAPFLAPVLLAAAGGTPTRAAADTLTSQAAASVSFPSGLFWPLGVQPAFGAMAVPLVVLPFAIAALWRGRGAVRGLGAVALATAVLALGPYAVNAAGSPLGGVRLWLPTAALDLLPGMARFWWCYRWLTLAIPASIVGIVVALRARPALLFAVVLFGLGETACVLRGGSPLPRLPRQGVRAPPALDQLAAAPDPSPILVLPKGDVHAIFVGWQAWFRQPTDLGLGGHLPGVAPTGYAEAAAATPLGRALADPSAPAPASWTAADTGGFRFVLLFFRDAAPGSRAHDAETAALEARLTTLFGRPAARNDVAAWWRIPGP